MRVLVRKISSFGMLKFRLVIGTLVLLAGMICVPVSIVMVDIRLFLNPYVLLVVLAGMSFFGLVAFFFCIRPYLVYRSLPDVLAETDGEFLYIHTKKEAKIPLAAIEEATMYVDLPYSLVQDNFLAELLLHLGTEEYGTVILELPGHGTFKMRFAAHAEESGDELIGFIKDLFKEENAG